MIRLAVDRMVLIYLAVMALIVLGFALAAYT